MAPKENWHQSSIEGGKSNSAPDSASSNWFGENDQLSQRTGRVAEVIQSGLKQGAGDVLAEVQNNKLLLPCELTSSIAIGSGIGWLSRRTGLLQFAGRTASAAMGIGFACDVFNPGRWQKFGNAVSDSWNAKPSDNLSSQKSTVAEYIGKPLTHFSIMNLAMIGTGSVVRNFHASYNKNSEPILAGQGTINCSATKEVLRPAAHNAESSSTPSFNYSWKDGISKEEEKQLVSNYRDVVNDLLPKSLPGIVKIEASSGHGTGFVLKNGLIATNQHCMPSYGMDCTIRLPDGSSSVGHSVWESINRDLAFVKITDKEVAKKLQPVTLLTDMKDVQEPLVAIGYPGSERGEVHVAPGQLSLIGIWDLADLNTHWLQTECFTKPGYSGGPLLDSCGRVVGINKGAQASGGVALYAKHIADALDEYERVKIPWHKLQIQRTPSKSNRTNEAYMVTKGTVEPEILSEHSLAGESSQATAIASIQTALARYAANKGNYAEAVRMYNKAEYGYYFGPKWLQEYGATLNKLGRYNDADRTYRFSRYSVERQSSELKNTLLDREHRSIYLRSRLIPAQVKLDLAEQFCRMGLQRHQVPGLIVFAKHEAAELHKYLPKDSAEQLQALVLSGDVQRLSAIDYNSNDTQTHAMKRAARAALTLYRAALKGKQMESLDKALVLDKMADSLDILGENADYARILRTTSLRFLAKQWGNDTRLLPYLEKVISKHSESNVLPWHEKRLDILKKMHGDNSPAVAAALYFKLIKMYPFLSQGELRCDVARFKTIEEQHFGLNHSKRWQNLVDCNIASQ